MATIIHFPHPALASATSREASEASNEALTPADRAVRVDRIDAHQSDGMRSRCDHLGIAVTGAPMSAAKAECVGQSSIMLRNDEGRRDMNPLLGHIVLKCKANMSCDAGTALDDYPRAMARMTETEEKAAFIKRVKAARMARYETQNDICELLNIPQGTYKQYETRTPLPLRFIPKFCIATAVSMEWLLTGEGQGPRVEQYIKHVPKRVRVSAPRRRTKAA